MASRCSLVVIARRKPQRLHFRRALHSPKTSRNPARKCRPTKGGSVSRKRQRTKSTSGTETNLYPMQKESSERPKPRSVAVVKSPGLIPKDGHATTCQSHLPLIVSLSRQSHFRLRALKHRASVAACLTTGLENPFLPQSLPFRKSGLQLRTLPTGSNQEVSHRNFFRQSGNFPAIDYTP